MQITHFQYSFRFNAWAHYRRCIPGPASLAILMLVLGILLQSAVFAQGEYAVEVAVNGQANDEKMSAYQVAMRIVLLRNSGDKTLLNRDDIRKALGNAETYVQQFGYRIPGSGEKITSETPLTRRVRETSQATHLLSVQFAGVLINELIQGQIKAAADEADTDDDDVDEPTEPTSALVWLLIEDGSNAHLIGGQTGTNIIARSREIAGGVGQSLIFPTMDAEDQQKLTSVDIRSGNQINILAASDRYQQSVILAGLLTRSDGRTWVTNWSRYYNGSVEELAGESASLDQSLQQGINWLTPGRPTNATQAPTGFAFGDSRSGAQALIWVSSLDTPAQYARIMRMLSAIETVEHVYPQEVMDTGILFALSPRVALNDVARRIAQTDWIRATSIAAPPVGTAAARSSIRQADAFFEYLR